MSVLEVEAPVSAPIEIEVEPNTLQKQLLRIRELVEGGRWCRNMTNTSFFGITEPFTRHCMFGLIERVENGG